MKILIRGILLSIILCIVFLIPAGCAQVEPQGAGGETDPAEVTDDEEPAGSGDGPEEESGLQEDGPDADGAPGEGISVDGIIGEGEYSSQLKDDATGIELYWSHDSRDLYLGIISGATGWVSVGFDPANAMRDANMIFMAFDGDTMVVRDDFGTGTFTHDQDLELGGTSDINQFAGTLEGDRASYELAIPLDSGDEFDKVLSPGNSYRVIMAVNSGGIDFDSIHTARSSGDIQLD